MKLSDFELEVMQVMWQMGPCIATEVHEAIAEKRKVAYSTVKTIIDRLEEKNAVRRVRNYGRTILYETCISREDLSPPMVHSFIDKLFMGNIRPLFNHALKEENITLDDVDYLEKMLASKRKELEE